MSGNPVWEFRREHKLTRLELAGLLAVSEETIYKWEKLKEPTRVVRLALLALGDILESDECLNSLPY